MNLITDTFFNIDYATNKLIFLFKSGKYESMDFEELSWMVSQLNQYQYFYLVNEVILEIEITKENLNLFFIFQYTKKVYSHNLNKPILTGTKFNYGHSFNHYYKSINYLEPEIGLLELFQYTEQLEKKLLPLILELPHKLIHIDSIISLKEETALFVLDVEYNLMNGLPTNRIGELNSLCEVIKNDLEIYYGDDILPREIVEYYFNENFENLKERFLSLNPFKKNLNNFGMSLFPIIYGIEEWKKFVISSISKFKGLETQKRVRDYYISCLNTFEILTSQQYIKINYSLYNVNALKKWVKTLNLENLNSTTNQILAENNFDLKIQEHNLEILYKGLKQKGFVDPIKTSYEDFSNVFTLDWNSHESILYLEFDHPQTKFFFNKLNVKLDLKLSFRKIESSKKIKNKNGLIKAASLYSSTSRHKKYLNPIINSGPIIEILENLK